MSVFEPGNGARYDLDLMRELMAAHPDQVAAFRRASRAAARPSATPGAESRPSGESAGRLAALGYFSGSPTVAPSMRDPKRMAALAERMENAIAREQTDPAAVRELRAVVDADPSNPLARRHLAIALSARSEYAAAIREIDQLRQMGDMSTETTILLGECERLAGRTSDAVATLQELAGRDQRNPDALDALGRALVASGQRDEAAGVFVRALALQPDDAEALAGLADLAIERGDLNEARVRLESLRARDPDDPGAAVKLGSVLARSGDLPAAAAVLKPVVDRFPRNVDALVNLAAALAKMGDASAAALYFARAVSAGAVSPVVLNGLAAARLQSGDRAGGVSALRQSLTLRPDQHDIRELLQRVESERRSQR